MRLKKDNRGSAMIIIIVVIAFVSILVSTLYTVVALNVQMKNVDRKSKKNFYSAEGVLEQINLGLQGEMSVAAEKAYKEVMQNYTTSNNETARQLKFNSKLVADLEESLKDATLPSTDPKRYDLAKLENYLKDDVKWDATNQTGAQIDSPFVGENLVIDSVSKEFIILKDVKITYTDSDGYQSIIETDIRLSSPQLNLVEEGDIPSIFEYSLIANEQLRAPGAGSAIIRNNVYAGQIKLDKYNLRWDFQGTGRVISKGDISIEGATLNVDTNKELWANEIGVGNDGRFFANGRTYVADDLELGKNAEAGLSGEYYGFGNGMNLDANGNSRVPGGPSSAILVNGTRAKLDLSGLSRLLISGSAQIATGAEEYNPTLAGSTPIERNEYENMRGGSIPSGFYKIHSVEDADDYWTIVNQYAVVDRNSTVIRVAYNADATISFYDNTTSKYFKVNSDGSITANADRISTETKFTPEYPQGKPGQYALKAAMNSKYVTVSDRNTLTATRDKVTSEYQLFTFEAATLSIPVSADVNNVLEPGTYAIYSYSEARYLQSVGQNNAIQATATVVGATTDNAEQFTLAREDDNGGFSLRTVTNPGYLKPEVNAASILVKPNGGNNRNDRLNIRLEPSDIGAGFYYLRTDDYYLFVDETTKQLQAVPANWTNPQNASEAQKRSGSFQFVLINPNVETGTGETETFEGTGVYPVYGMTYSDEDKAVATIQASALSNMTIVEARIRYQVTRNGVMVSDTTVPMTVNAGKATATISGLNNGDSVIYSISYKYASEDVLRTVDRNLYVHQRLTATGSPYENSNRNVNLGESVEIKSNQIAYLVPAECVGVYKDKTIFGHNPMTADEWNELQAAAKDIGTYPDGLEIVSLTKKVSSLNNKTLGYYAGTGNKGYQEVYVQSPTGGSSMVYLYVNFNDSDKTSEYFQDYYEKNQDTMQEYMKQYVPNLKTGNFDRLTLDGNMVTSIDGSKIDLKESGNYGLAMSADDKKEEEERYQQQFIGLCTNLKLEYSNGLNGDVYENLVRDDQITNVTYGNGEGTNGTDGTVTAIAKIVSGNYNYPSAGDDDRVCLILARGNVTINDNFSGIVIAKGDIIVSNGVTVTNNRDALKKILQFKTDNGQTIAQRYFKDVNLSGEGSDATITSETGYAKYSDCISYENWTKK